MYDKNNTYSRMGILADEGERRVGSGEGLPPFCHAKSGWWEHKGL